MAHRLVVATQSLILTGSVTHITQAAFEGRVEDALDKTRLTTAADTRDDGHHIQGDGDVDASQVVHAGTLDVYLLVPWATAHGNRNLLLVQQVFDGMALGEFGNEQ